MPADVASARPAIAARVGSVQFRLAGAEDDAAIRTFLRQQAMDGSIRLATATEPSFFDAMSLLGERADVLVAEDQSVGRAKVVGLGVRALRTTLVSGRAVNLAYFSLLRVAQDFRRRRDFLRTGYALLARLQEQCPADITLTAILSDNVAARRLLEAGHSGLPRYTPVTAIHTFTFGTSTRRVAALDRGLGGRVASPVAPDARPEIEAFLRQKWTHLDAAPGVGASLSAGAPCGRLRRDDFVAVRHKGALVAVGALWDQRPARQLLVEGYTGLLGPLRPIANLLRSLSGDAPLPPPGRPLSLAYLSHLAIDPEDASALFALIGGIARLAAARGIHYLTLSLPAAHPLRAAAASLATHTTESMLYAVEFPGTPPSELSTAPYIEAGLL